MLLAELMTAIEENINTNFMRRFAKNKMSQKYGIKHSQPLMMLINVQSEHTSIDGAPLGLTDGIVLFACTDGIVLGVIILVNGMSSYSNASLNF